MLVRKIGNAYSINDRIIIELTDSIIPHTCTGCALKDRPVLCTEFLQTIGKYCTNSKIYREVKDINLKII